MALSRLRSVFEAVLLVLLSVVQHATCQNDASSAQSQQMMATVTMQPRPGVNSMPTCTDPLTGAEGYEPFCPKGYFRCCATCQGAVCFSQEGLRRSWRGIKECKRCAPGDFCAGCDIYERCRSSDVKGREGPKISPPGSTRGQDCEICPSTYEADLKRGRCVKKWTDDCNMAHVGRCTRNCRAEEAKRGKNLNFCENMKCEMYCAKRWSDACANRFKEECEYRKAGPNQYDLYSEEEEWLTDCDVDCNGARHRQLSISVLLWCALAAMTRTLQG